MEGISPAENKTSQKWVPESLVHHRNPPAKFTFSSVAQFTWWSVENASTNYFKVIYKKQEGHKETQGVGCRKFTQEYLANDMSSILKFEMLFKMDTPKLQIHKVMDCLSWKAVKLKWSNHEFQRQAVSVGMCWLNTIPTTHYEANHSIC